MLFEVKKKKKKKKMAFWRRDEQVKDRRAPEST